MEKNILGYFYSKKNIHMAYKLRGLCFDRKVDLVNIEDLMPFFRQAVNLQRIILFVDCLEISGKEELFCMVKAHNERYDKIIVVLINADPQKYLQYSDCNILLTRLEDINDDYMDDLIKKIQEGENGAVSVYDTNVLKMKVIKQLNRYNISPKYLGYTYLQEVINHIVKHNKLKIIQTEIYGSIGKQLSVAPSSIEHSIRVAIDNGFEKSVQMKQKFSRKPSNKEFITTIINELLYSDCENAADL